MRVRRRLLRLRNPDNNFSGFGSLQVFASYFLDQPRIGLQRTNLIAKFDVFLIEAVQIFLHLLYFILRAPHCNKAMRTKNVVNEKRQNKKPRLVASMLASQSLSKEFVLKLTGARRTGRHPRSKDRLKLGPWLFRPQQL